MAAKTKPVHEIRIGRIRASIWENKTEQGETRYKVTVQLLFKDESGWHTTAGFGRDDLLLIGKVTDLAHTWICEQGK